MQDIKDIRSHFGAEEFERLNSLANEEVAKESAKEHIESSLAESLKPASEALGINKKELDKITRDLAKEMAYSDKDGMKAKEWLDDAGFPRSSSKQSAIAEYLVSRSDKSAAFSKELREELSKKTTNYSKTAETLKQIKEKVEKGEITERNAAKALMSPEEKQKLQNLKRPKPSGNVLIDTMANGVASFLASTGDNPFNYKRRQALMDRELKSYGEKLRKEQETTNNFRDAEKMASKGMVEISQGLKMAERVSEKIRGTNNKRAFADLVEAKINGEKVDHNIKAICQQVKKANPGINADVAGILDRGVHDLHLGVHQASNAAIDLQKLDLIEDAEDYTHKFKEKFIAPTLAKTLGDGKDEEEKSREHLFNPEKIYKMVSDMTERVSSVIDKVLGASISNQAEESAVPR